MGGIGLLFCVSGYTFANLWGDNGNLTAAYVASLEPDLFNPKGLFISIFMPFVLLEDIGVH